MQQQSYFEVYQSVANKFQDVFSVFEQELKKGNPETLEIINDLRSVVAVKYEEIDTTYYHSDKWFVKRSPDYDSITALFATLLAKACGVNCPNMWLVPIRFVKHLSIKEREDEKYVQVTSFYQEWEPFNPRDYVSPHEMGKLLAFDLSIGNSDRFGLHDYLDASSPTFLNEEGLNEEYVNTGNFSMRHGKLYSIDMSIEEENYTRYLYREVGSDKVQTALDWLAQYLSYDRIERRELEESYVEHSEKWNSNRDIKYLWDLTQIYMNGFVFYHK